MIGEQKFRKDKGIAPGVSLRQAGYSFDNDRFRLPDNFAIGPKGLTFLSGLYEIAGYAQGITELFIEYGEIHTLISRTDRSARSNASARGLPYLDCAAPSGSVSANWISTPCPFFGWTKISRHAGFV